MSVSDLVKSYKELTEHRSDYERADAFYKGEVEEIHSSIKIQRLLAKSGLNDLGSYNFAHVPVDSLAEKLYINSITADNDAAQQAIEDLWEFNELGMRAPMHHKEAGKFGDSYLMCWPRTDDLGNVIAVDMTCKDPTTTRVFYDEENERIKSHAIQSWCEGSGTNKVTRANLYYPDRIERYILKGTSSATSKSTKWEPFTEDGRDAVLANPTGQVPFFHFRTELEYGAPDHVNAYGPQLVINKIIVAMAAALDFESWPQRFALLDPNADNPNSSSELDPDWPEDTDAAPQEPANASNLSADPSSLWELTARQVGQFEAANMDSFLKPLDRSVKAMAQVTGTPFQAFDSTGAAISGQSRREANESFYTKAEARQMGFGAVWRAAFEFSLELLGIDVNTISVTWRPVRTINDAEGWKVIETKIKLGVPPEIALAEAGYLPSDIETWGLPTNASEAVA